MKTRMLNGIAYYSGTICIIYSVNFGNKRANLHSKDNYHTLNKIKLRT